MCEVTEAARVCKKNIVSQVMEGYKNANGMPLNKPCTFSSHDHALNVDWLEQAKVLSLYDRSRSGAIQMMKKVLDSFHTGLPVLFYVTAGCFVKGDLLSPEELGKGKLTMLPPPLRSGGEKPKAARGWGPVDAFAPVESDKECPQQLIIKLMDAKAREVQLREELQEAKARAETALAALEQAQADISNMVAPPPAVLQEARETCETKTPSPENLWVACLKIGGAAAATETAPPEAEVMLESVGSMPQTQKADGNKDSASDPGAKRPVGVEDAFGLTEKEEARLQKMLASRLHNTREEYADTVLAFTGKLSAAEERAEAAEERASLAVLRAEEAEARVDRAKAMPRAGAEEVEAGNDQSTTGSEGQLERSLSDVLTPRAAHPHTSEVQQLLRAAHPHTSEVQQLLRSICSIVDVDIPCVDVPTRIRWVLDSYQWAHCNMQYPTVMSPITFQAPYQQP